MPDTPLNPDALEAAVRAFQKNANAYMQALYTSDEVIEDAIEAYLAVAQSELQANSKPNQNLEFVNSVEELDALPVGAVVQTQEGVGCIPENIIAIAVKQPSGWDAGWDWECGLKAEDIVPARVLYLPEVKP